MNINNPLSIIHYQLSIIFLGQARTSGVFFMMDATILGQLVDEHAAALELYARQWCAAPEDVVQEAFLKLVVQRQLPRNVVPWLFRVVRNRAISDLRSAQRRRKHESQAAAQQPQRLFAGEPAALDGEVAARALRTLPEEQREAITLHLWGGLTFAEIAEVVDSSASSVHRWYLAGLNHLRERLEVPCPDPMKKS
jgi:RNA polymerase sigma factor (sigma-70 family)